MFTFLRIACGVLIAATVASADPVTFQFTGTVTQVIDDDFSTNIKPQDTFQGSFTFDSNTSSSSSTPTGAGYDDFINPHGMTVDVGPHNFSISNDALSIGIQNGAADLFSVFAENFISPGLIFHITLRDPSGAALSSVALPLSPPDLSAFSQRDFFLREVDVSGNQTDVQGRIDSLTACPSCGSVVPEPAGIWLIAILPALAYRRSNRQPR